MANADVSAFDDGSYVMLSPAIRMASNMFPFEPDAQFDDGAWIQPFSYLPSYDRTIFLIGKYHGAPDRQAIPVKPSQTEEELIPLFYPSRKVVDTLTLCKDNLHDLGLLFSLLATGCSNDHSLPQINAEAESYAHLSRAALTFHNVFEHASLPAVQTILVLGSYTKAIGKPNHTELAWNLMGFAFQLAMSVRITVLNYASYRQPY